MKQFLTTKFHGINVLVLSLFTLLLIYSPLSSSVDFWFSDHAYFTVPKDLSGKFLYYLAEFGFFLCLFCIATLWISRLNNWIVVAAMIIYMLIIVNLVYPNFNEFFSSFYLPLIVTLCILCLIIWDSLKNRG